MLNNFKIIIPFYNAGKYIERCVLSVLTQKYEGNFHIIITNDCSTDSSEGEILKYIEENKEKITYIKNNNRKTALENIHNMIMNHCENEDIVVFVDGDDFLMNKNVITYLNDFYNDSNNNNPWIVYGQFMFSTRGVGFASAYSHEEYKKVRFSPFKVSHIRTIKAGLYHKIKEQDENFDCMKDKNGFFYKISYDVAIFFPLMDMCPFEKIKFNSKPLYVYNFENPISDHVLDQKGQTNTHIEISKKKPFKKIESYK